MQRWSMLLIVLVTVPGLPLIAQDTLPPPKTGAPPVLPRPATRTACDSLGLARAYDALPQADRAIDPPRILRAGPLRTPDGLAGVNARVVLNLVIDSTGHVAPCSVHVIMASDVRFVAAATETVERMVFAPAHAQADGRPVNSYIQLPIVWQRR